MNRVATPAGQGDAFARMRRQARALRMHHGVLLTGARGLGKSLAAECLAQALLCTGDDPDAPCGRCPACRHFANHPDLHRVAIPEDKDEIPVDLVRELQQSLQRLPVEGRARVVVVDPADRLNVQGQNAMLKTLEEPGHHTFLLLPTRRPEALLETVRSRVTELRLLPLPAAALDAELAAAGVAAADRAWAVRHAGGALGQARELADPEVRGLFDRIAGAVLGGAASPVSAARTALEGVSGRIATAERARLVLWMVGTILRKELLDSLATERTGPYSADTSVRWTAKIETLFGAESDLALRIPPEQVLARVFATVC